MTIGDELNNIMNEFQNEIRRAFYFMKEGFQNIDVRLKEAKDYHKEFECDIKLLEENQSRLKDSDQFARFLRESLPKIDILSRLFEFANNQQETAYRMTHVYMISIYEGFTKEMFKKVYNKHLEFLKSNKYPLSKIISMDPDELKSLISNKIDKIANVKNLEDILNGPDIRIDIKTLFTDWNSLKENYCRRHVIVHNHGIFDQDYVKDTGSPTNLIGTEIKTDFEYMKQLAHNICNYIGFLGSNIISILRSPISTVDIKQQAESVLNRLKKYIKK